MCAKLKFEFHHHTKGAIYETKAKRGGALAVRIYCTAPQGGILCEDRALDMVPVLENLGADCTVGQCGFDGKSGLFSICVQARWETAAAE